MDFAHFVPAPTGDLGIASYALFSGGMTDVVAKSEVMHEFFMGTKATPEGFLSTLAKPIGGVGFMGHSFDIAANPPFSVVLRFSTTSSALVRPSTPTDNPQYSTNDPGIRLVTTSQIETQAKVVFIGACFTGPVFENLWNIHSATATQPATKGQALIVLSNPSSTVLLGHALAAWERILDDMVNKHMNVGDAVAETDKYLPTISVPEQYTVIGDPSVKLTP